MHFDAKPPNQHLLQTAKFKGEYFYAERIAPFCYQLPLEVSQFLSERIIVSIVPNSLLKNELKGIEGNFIGVFSDANWIKFKGKIESLPINDVRVRRVQRVVLGNAHEQPCRDGLLDLSGLGSVLDGFVKEGLLHDDTMLLRIETRCIRMIIPSRVSRLIL